MNLDSCYIEAIAEHRPHWMDELIEIELSVSSKLLSSLGPALWRGTAEVGRLFPPCSKSHIDPRPRLWLLKRFAFKHREFGSKCDVNVHLERAGVVVVVGFMNNDDHIHCSSLSFIQLLYIFYFYHIHNQHFYLNELIEYENSDSQLIFLIVQLVGYVNLNGLQIAPWGKCSSLDALSDNLLEYNQNKLDILNIPHTIFPFVP
ncbi:hypothetical protein T11_18626 [Trichinella zimbabwensis]|uniref:Uncharacterized protein n=1 Tax=Trichinella zimbabwensis TaxID=268475 RepID=A0A0V1H3I5_9BILA|nr:hypothetical protein T11_18626 [Trichinella zimbabwensis]